MLSPVFATALQGMKTAQERLSSHSERLVRLGEDGTAGDPAGNMAGVALSRRGYEANAAVARTADRMLGSIIDILA
jgi:hypothetical protein